MSPIYSGRGRRPPLSFGTRVSLRFFAFLVSIGLCAVLTHETVRVPGENAEVPAA